MIMITNETLSGILAKKGLKLCSGLEGKKCFRPRRSNGRLCKECHRDAMRSLRAKASGKRERVVDGYDFNQENYI